MGGRDLPRASISGETCGGLEGRIGGCHTSVSGDYSVSLSSLLYLKTPNGRLGYNDWIKRRTRAVFVYPGRPIPSVSLIMQIPNGLCVGLDPDLNRIPRHLRDRPDAVVHFLSAIVESTRPHAAAFKLNTAFFEQYGRKGLDALYAVRDVVGDSYCIIDAKRGDIGNTSAAYARSIFDDLGGDAVTVAPYMGSDSVEPFLAYEGKTVLILALTSNPGSADFQRMLIGGQPLYKRVMHVALRWKGPARKGFVVGATHVNELAALRSRFHEIPFLIPGLGAQGGDVSATMKANQGGPALLNSSRGILYAHDGEDYAEKAAEVASRLSAKIASRSK